ncbi:hemolysin family protein [Amycolatopsis alkalitolerans]|uniref:HlyC/CorC family transporter n=1 Tax=Amycolatopsis alkalitolerans TaxID=2547244 RepID=A0A5C4LV93_9PSEU|nr:hemolysin family protein [Amycolatopsis alkalitolerans]TNC21573.1 HlyC/CorC family transporter [Amycolatopsis alkalitolerans]
MDSIWVTGTLVGLLILLNALFAGTEIALISLREGQLRQLEHRDSKAASALLRLVAEPTRYLATIQLGITLSGFLASATAAVSLAQPLIPLLGFLGRAAEPAAIAVVTAALTFLTLVFGELAPKRLAMQYAQPWALIAARPLHALTVATRPAVWALSGATDLAARAFGGLPGPRREQPSSDELREVVVGHRGLHPEQRAIIAGALDIQQRRLRDILVPRRAVVTLTAGTPIPEARAALVAAGHSRAPVSTTGHLDDVVGVAHLRDLLADSGAVGDVSRPPVLFPETLRVSEALHRFKAERQKFALVVAERGTVEGIVTRQDLLDEITGEIEEQTRVRWEPAGSVLLPGTFGVHDLPDLGISLTDRPPGDYVTVAGLVLVALGRIPQQPGDRVRCGEWTIEVTGVDHHAITGVRVCPARVA